MLVEKLNYVLNFEEEMFPSYVADSIQSSWIKRNMLKYNIDKVIIGMVLMTGITKLILSIMILSS